MSTINLHLTASTYEITTPTHTLSIQKQPNKDGECIISTTSTQNTPRAPADQVLPIKCIFKTIQLKSGIYLIAVAKTCLTPAISLLSASHASMSASAAEQQQSSSPPVKHQHEALAVKSFHIIGPHSEIFNNRLRENYFLSEDMDEIEYIHLLQQTLANGGQFYYGTNSWNLSKRFFGLDSSKRYDTAHYCWNFETFERVALHDVVPAFIRGYAASYDTNQQQGGAGKVTVAVLSRVSYKNAGTRYNARGVNEDGYAANSVETEQILVNHRTDRIYSFLQIRGSIPVYWTQFTNLKYNPPIIVDQHRAQDGYASYMNSQLERYQNIVCISLVNNKGVEKPLAVEFENQSRAHASDNVKFVPFDFHKECKGMKYENIDLVLWPQIENAVRSYGFHVRDAATMEVLQKQVGVPRTNCKDSLDRTNVVQSAIGRKVFEEWLRLDDNGRVLKDQETLQQCGGEFWNIFRLAWADNGDAVSTLYAGTGALKADYTRTGKRSLYGVWQDFTSSVKRYYLNNFTDGAKQDGVNLLTGAHVVDKHASPFSSVYRGRLLQTLLRIGIFGVIAALLPRQS